jgi:MSHA biogenesis protein MshJ
MATDNRLQQWRDKLAEFSDREKWMLAITGFVLVVGVLDFFVIQPMRDQRALFEQQIETLRMQQVDFSQQQTELLEQIEADPAMAMGREVEGLEKAITASEEKLRSFTQSLVSPGQMSEMLRAMLENQQGLKLLELTNLPVSPLLKNEQQATSSDSGIGLFRHPVRLVFEGNYSDTLAYLERLEEIPNKFYWYRFDYQVKEYPLARVSVNIYTLSTQEWWIGEDDS